MAIMEVHRVKLIDDDRICQHVRKHKTFEPETIGAWREACRPFTSVIDIGAYSGLFAIIAAQKDCCVTAIEPMPNMFERIMENAELNNIKLVAIKAAASDKRRIGEIHYNEKVHLTAGASLDRKSGGSHKVNIITIDDLKIFQVSAIKIDVERHELNVLEGMRETLKRERPKLFIETLSDGARKSVEDYLTDYRTIAFLDNRNLVMEKRQCR